MLDQFRTGTLPGVEPRKYAETDTATFYDLLDATTALLKDCVGNKRTNVRAGWSYAGKSVDCRR